MRTVDWRPRMEENLQRVKSTPFEWGVHDCALFAASHVNVISADPEHRNLDEVFKGKYSTALGSIKALKQQGYDSLRDLLKSKFEEIHPVFAGRGDLVIALDEEGNQAIGICLGEHCGFLRPEGYGYLIRTSQMIKWAYRV